MLIRRSPLYVAGLVARALLANTKVRIGLVVLGTMTLGTFFLCRPSPPKERLTPKETEQVYTALLARVERGGPNHLHSRRLYHYAPPFAKAAGASVDVVQAAALLHDSTKEDGEGEPKDRFCSHGEQGADFALATLTKIGKSDAFATAASTAVREHMGPCGFNWRFFSRRFMTKFCGRTYPKPSSPESQVLYDIDMLDLMTVDGVVKVAELRQKNPEFKKEPLKDSVKDGQDSAYKSVIDANQTLITDAARSCGEDLVEHTEAFIEGLDFEKVKDIPALKRAASEYLEKHPFPKCLPAVPPDNGGPRP